MTVPTTEDWLSAWRDLVGLMHGLTQEDQRFAKVMAGLEFADEFFLAGDWNGFQRAVDGIRDVMTKGVPDGSGARRQSDSRTAGNKRDAAGGASRDRNAAG